MMEYVQHPNGQIVRCHPKIKGKAAVKADRKARRKAWRDLQDIKRLAQHWPGSELAQTMAQLEEQAGVEVKV